MIRPLAGIFVLLGVASAIGHAQPAGVIIGGRVVADDTGTPLPHARLVIYNDATPLPPIFTDAEGRFSSPPLASGRYHLTATKAGYVMTAVSRISSTAVDVRMPRSASLSGRLFDLFGDAASGIPVQVSAITTTGPPVVVKTATSDDLGEYRVGGLAAGSYVVTLNNPLGLVAAPPPSAGPTNFPPPPSVTDPQTVQLTAGEQKSGVDFSGVPSVEALTAMATAQLSQLPNVRIVTNVPVPSAQQLPEGTATIRGRITRGDGLAVPRATVTALPQRTAGDSRTNFASKNTTTDEDGRYEFTGLLRGSYRLRANKSGFNSSVYGEQSTQGTPIAVGENQTRSQVDFVLPRHGTIVGQVFDDFGDPVDGAIMSVWQIRFQAGRRRLVGVNGASVRATDDLGRYRIFGLPPGQYVVSASLGQLNTQGAGADISGFAPTYFPGTTTADQARLVAVSRSQDVGGIDIALVALPTASISGRRIGSDGQPMGGSLVLTQSQRSGAIVTPAAGARIALDGRFEFPNVAPGEYVIHADSGKSNNAREGDFVSQFVTVNGTNVTGIVLLATPGSSISGRVVFDGDPPQSIRGINIEPTRADPDRTPLSNGSIARAELRPDLTFAMDGIHGPRRLTVANLPSGWMLKSVVASGLDVTDMALPFGTRDESLSDVVVVLTNRVTELSGTVSDSRGQPALEYSLLVFPTDRERWYPGSRFFRRSGPAQAGNFVVRGVPPGDYFIAPVVAGTTMLSEGQDAWQDPEFLDSIALRAARATLSDGGKISVSARLITP